MKTLLGLFIVVQAFFSAPIFASNTPIVNKLNSEIVKIMNSPAMLKKMNDIGAETFTDNPEQFARFIAKENQFWGNLIKSLIIKPE